LKAGSTIANLNGTCSSYLGLPFSSSSLTDLDPSETEVMLALADPLDVPRAS
jgi:hypothetical protein